MRGSGDPHRRWVALAGVIGHILVPDRFAALCDCASGLSCRFFDVDPEHALKALCPGHRTAFLWTGIIRIRLPPPAAPGRGDLRNKLPYGIVSVFSFAKSVGHGRIFVLVGRT